MEHRRRSEATKKQMAHRKELGLPGTSLGCKLKPETVEKARRSRQATFERKKAEGIPPEEHECRSLAMREALARKKERGPLPGEHERRSKAVSEAVRGKKNPGVSKALKGRPHSPEHSRKIGEALKGRTMSEDAKAKLREALARKKEAGMPPEEFARRSAAMKALAARHRLDQSPEAREKRCAAARKARDTRRANRAKANGDLLAAI